MKIDRFQMERTQCLYENEVEFNLSESGVEPLSIAELLPDADERAALAAAPLRYPHSTGRERLRRNIAAFHGLADAGSGFGYDRERTAEGLARLDKPLGQLKKRSLSAAPKATA